jgi:hypothetical protein
MRSEPAITADQPGFRTAGFLDSLNFIFLNRLN